MRIAEISCTPDHRRSSSSADSDHSTILSLMESSIRSLERHLPAQPLPKSFYSELRQAVAQLNKLAPFANFIRLVTWKLSYRLCNTCVGLSNASSAKISEEHAEFRQAAAELLFLTADVVGIPSPEFKAALFFYKTGLIWYELRQLNLSNNFYEKAADPITLWNRSETVLFGIARSCIYLTFRKSLLSMSEASNVNGALKLMNNALELCEKGLTVVRRTDETLNLKKFRFIAAAHLQINDFESVLKCVNVLREVGSGDHHPSLSLLAKKAWLGLGNFEKTEKELRGMAIDKGVWVSVVESYFQATGAAGAETVKGAFIGLLEHSQDEGMQGGARVVTELISGQSVVALEGASEITAIHALLFNCETENFRSKDYWLGAEIFEKSILFVAHGTENRLLKAKGYRVLCLCYLGLLQLNRAKEYANEAEKLEPNIASACLKFKIFLQKNNHNHAISQMQAMFSCLLDFTTDFISQADHEAVSSRALPIATASLEPCLSFVGQKGGETGTSKEMRGFSLLPGDQIEQIMVRSRFNHPWSKRVSKHFNEMLISKKHFKEREREGHQEVSIYFCIRTSPEEYNWYTELRDGQGWECRRLPRIPEQQGLSSVVGVGSSIYVIGGLDTRGRELNSLFIFDGIRNRQHIGSPMNVCRYAAPCGVWNDTIYIFGSGAMLEHSYWAEKYIIQSGSWEEVPGPSFFPLFLLNMTSHFFVKDSIIYAVLSGDHMVTLDMRTQAWELYTAASEVFDRALMWNRTVEIGGRTYANDYDGIRVVTDVRGRSDIMRNLSNLIERSECTGSYRMVNLNGNIGIVWIRMFRKREFCVTCTEIRIEADEAGVPTGTLVRRQNHENVATNYPYSRVEACIALKF